jgi:hypothetical protein
MAWGIQIIDLNQLKSPVAYYESREQNYEPENYKKALNILCVAQTNGFGFSN